MKINGIDNTGVEQVQEGKNINNGNHFEQLSQKEIFAKKINSILEKNGGKIKGSDIEAITRFLKIKMKSYISENNFGFFSKYLEKLEEDGNNMIIDEVFEKKFQKYFPIHEEVFFKNLNEEIENLDEKNQENIENVIKNFLSKYLHIIFIFSEKIKLTDLDKYLKSNIEDLSFTFSSARNDLNLLNNFGKEIFPKLKKRFKEEEIENDSEDFYMSEKFFTSLYRRLYKEIEEGKNADENDKIKMNKGTVISEKIEEEYKKAFNEIFYIFETWIEYGYKDNEKLKNLEIFTRKLFEGLIFMKKENIAFRNFPIRKIDDNFTDYVEKYFFDFGKIKSDFKNEFILFLKYVSESDFNGLKTELREKIKQKEKEIANSRVPNKTERIDNLNINEVDFELWEKVEEAQKYENVFSEVISKDGKIKFADFLELDNEKYFEIFSDFCVNEYFKKDKKKTEEENQKNIKFFKENLKKQLEEIKKCEGKTVKEFIEEDVNNLNLLILWWRFILKTRTLDKKSDEKNTKNIINLGENRYGVIEEISKRLKEKNILDSEKIKFNIDGKVRNTSIEGKDLGIDELIKALKRGFVDLRNKKINLTNGDSKVIGSIKELYIPAKLNSDNLQRNLDRDTSAIETHLDDGIDLCYSLLKNKDISEDSTEYHYLKNVLIAKKIIPEDYKNLDIKDKEKLQDLVEVLKFIRSRIKLLKEMMIVGVNDRNDLEKDKTIKNLLRKHKDSSIGPEKAFKRAFEKLIGEYSGNFNQVGDLTRARVVSKDLDTCIEDIVNFIDIVSKKDNITNISIVDSTGEPISIPKKNSGYRDIKLFLKLKSGNTVEVQFQVEEMYEIKDKGINLELEENKNIFEKMRKEGALLTNEEMKELLKYSKARNIDLPTKNILKNLMIEEDDINWEEFEEILKGKQISTDYSYHIVRQLEKGSSIKSKLTRLERILADSAWSKIVIKYLKNRNIKID